jgi:uncharacterized membrane protein YeaQ/YmgE (transglycosylase-associated protein family)
MTHRRRWISLVGSFLIGVCLGLIARYLWPGFDPSWAWLVYLVVGTVGGVLALTWLALLLAEKLP